MSARALPCGCREERHPHAGCRGNHGTDHVHVAPADELFLLDGNGSGTAFRAEELGPWPMGAGPFCESVIYKGCPKHGALIAMQKFDTMEATA